MLDQTNPSAGNDSRPLLSILLPAYKYREGVQRILSLLKPQSLVDCELLVFDNSPDNEVEQEVMRWRSVEGMQVTYHHNYPEIGAAGNWNALLDRARGEYCLLLHHDEFPLSDNFVVNLIRELRKAPEVDVMMLDCLLVNPRSGRNRRHLPMWFRELIVSRFPQYLFRRNVIGPTASLVVRRTLYPRFDPRLRWFIDVDVYVQLFEVAKGLRLCPKIQIGSILGRVDSITAGLGAGIPQIAREDRTHLRNIHHTTTSLWLGPSRNGTILHFLLRVCEAVCWNLMRGLTRIASVFFVGPVPRSVVKKAIEIPFD
jgi:glycosyltransferase involved in cell wall biosynthesis